ncbi:MAG: DUF1461 domain-containing protein [Coriobacteriia bacterium]
MRRSEGPLTVETCLVAIACLVAVIGLSLAALTAPVFTALLVPRVGSAALTGLGEEQTLAVAEKVRLFVTDPAAPALPLTVGDRSAFDAAATSHLRDVRAVLVGARTAAGTAAAVVAVWLAAAFARRRRGRARRALRAAAALTAGTVAVAALAGAADFERLFAALHGLFFAAGTWTFPADSLLIEVFPERFWVVLGAAWGALALTGAALLWAVARLVPGDRG